MWPPQVLAGGADWLHVDVFDGHFVPNLTIGPCVVSSLRKALGDGPVLDCHLCVTNPEDYVAPMSDAGASIFTFHAEATSDAASLVAKVKAAGMKAGVALSPETGADAAAAAVDAGADLVLVLTVKPGFGGQKFMEAMMPKVRECRERWPNVHVQVDGGVNETTVALAADAGASCCVAGSAVFKSADPAATIAALKGSLQGALDAAAV